MNTKNLIRAFKLIGLMEAASFLILLLIAMPMKYIWDRPEMVSIVGMAHGVLFILYIFGAYWVYEKLDWKAKTFFIVLFCSIIPLGPIYAERKYLKD